MLTLYQKDFNAWVAEQAALLQKRDFSNLDIEHLLEEMETLGSSNKDAIESHMIIVLMHMLKQIAQPERWGKSWDSSISNGQAQIAHIIEKNPSLRRYPEEVLDYCFKKAVRRAQKEVGKDAVKIPTSCRWTISQILGE
jgi:hypothetical protein